MWPFKKKPRNQVRARDKPDKPRASGRWLSVHRVRADNTMRGNEAIYAAVSRIANTVASMPLHLYKGYERQIGHPLERLVAFAPNDNSVSYTHLRAHETGRNLVCRLLLEKKKKQYNSLLYTSPNIIKHNRQEK